MYYLYLILFYLIIHFILIPYLNIPLKEDYYLLLFISSIYFEIPATIIISLIILSIIDYYETWIPNTCIILIGISMLINNNLIINNYEGIITSIIFGLLIIIISHILKKELMGFGDLKLFIVLSINMDFMTFMLLLFTSSLLGLITYLFNKKKMFPFGPSIAVGYLLMCIINKIIV